LAPGTTAVRIFHRSFDAALLGGLQKLAGPNYGNSQNIRARYLFDGRKVTVGNVIVDGKPIAGIIDLSRSRFYCARKV